MKISIIGGGNMGGAIARGLADSGILPPEQITVINRREVKTLQMKETHPRIHAVTGDYSSLAEADVVVIAVKPWMVQPLIEEHLAQRPCDGQILVSVAAGISLAELEAWVGCGKSIVCAIPNTAAEVRQSMTFISGIHVSEAQKEAVLGLFQAIGRAEWIEERLLGPATVLCSCGIAFAFRYIRAAMEGGVELGLYPQAAKQGILQTLRGAIELLEQHDSHPEEEIDKVTTPGGLTIKGLNEMEHAGFTSAVIRGLKASNS